jgi:hypothetical protein
MGFFITCTRNNSASAVSCDARLDVVVRPHRRHLRLERLERELERRARIPDLELLKHARMQNPQLADLHVSRPRVLRIGGRPRAIKYRRGTTREERRVCTNESIIIKNLHQVKYTHQFAP